MKVWFDGEGQIACDLEQVERALEDPGKLHVGLVGLMPSLTEVALVEQGPGTVTIRTSEGIMTRSNISHEVGDGSIIVEFDEVYQAGSLVTATSHFRDEFSAIDGGVHHHLVISDLNAPGFVGFFYRSFGSRNIGKAILEANKQYFEGLGG